MPFVPEDRLTFVGADGTVFLSLRNMAATYNVVIKNKTVIGKAELTTFVFEPIFIEQRGKASGLPLEKT